MYVQSFCESNYIWCGDGAGIAHNGAAIGVFGVVIVISYGHTVIFAHLFPVFVYF